MPETNQLKELIAIREAVTGNSNSSTVYSVANYSATIAAANVSQDLAAAAADRIGITIQNLDETDKLLVGIDENAQIGRSYEIEPRGIGQIEFGEASKRISVLSSKAGLRFVAIGTVKVGTDAEPPTEPIV